MISPKIIIYGTKDSAVFLSALKMQQDNPFLTAPKPLTTPKSVKHFLSDPHNHLGMIEADNYEKAIRYVSEMNKGFLFLVASSGILHDISDDIINNAVWNGSSSQETWEKHHS